jgi:hypothetical protein
MARVHRPGPSEHLAHVLVFAAEMLERFLELRRSPGSWGQPLAAARPGAGRCAPGDRGPQRLRQDGERHPSTVISSPVPGGHGSGRRAASAARTGRAGRAWSRQADHRGAAQERLIRLRTAGKLAWRSPCRCSCDSARSLPRARSHVVHPDAGHEWRFARIRSSSPDCIRNEH